MFTFHIFRSYVNASKRGIFVVHTEEQDVSVAWQFRHEAHVAGRAGVKETS